MSYEDGVSCSPLTTSSSCMAEAAARTAHSDLYFLHKEKLEWLREHTEPQDLQRLRKLVQGATKPLVQTFDRAANKVKLSNAVL